MSPQTADATRTAFADETQNPTQSVAGGVRVSLDLIFDGVSFNPEDLFDAIEAKYGSSYATLSTNLAGADNDVTFTSRRPGDQGEGIRVRYVVSGNNTPLSIAVSGKDITVNVATDGSGVGTSTADQVIAAVNADSAASALVFATRKAANNGTGVVIALAYTALSGATGKVTNDKDTVRGNQYQLRISA